MDICVLKYTEKNGQGFPLPFDAGWASFAKGVLGWFLTESTALASTLSTRLTKCDSMVHKNPLNYLLLLSRIYLGKYHTIITNSLTCLCRTSNQGEKLHEVLHEVINKYNNETMIKWQQLCVFLPVYSGKQILKGDFLIFSANRSFLLRKRMMEVSMKNLLLQMESNSIRDSCMRFCKERTE